MLEKILPEGATSLRHYAYDIGPGRYYQPVYRYIAQELELSEGALLDVGCGPGWLSIYAAQVSPEVDCIGIDSSETMILLANRNKGRRLNVTFRHMDAREIIYPVDTFDRIVSVQSMHHWEEPERILAELRRVLKPGGRALLYAADPEAELPEGWIQRTGPWPPGSYVRGMIRRHSLDEAGFQAMLDRARALDWEVESDRHGFFRRIVATRPVGGDGS